MGAITRVSISGHFSRMNYVGWSGWCINPGSKSVSMTLCHCELPPHVFRRFHCSRPPDHERWSRLSQQMNVTSYLSRNNVVSQELTHESSAEALMTPAVRFYRSLTVFAVVLSTVFGVGGRPARAGVESTIQPTFNGLGEASTNKVSSVEAILAKQLARRFREMSDEELVLVLQELLKASRSSINAEDLVLDGKGPKDVRLEDGSKDDNRNPIDHKHITEDPFPQTGGAANEGPESSASSSKLEDSATKNVKEDKYKPVDGTRKSETKGGEAENGVTEMPVSGSQSVKQAPEHEKSVLTGTGSSEEALTTNNTISSSSARENWDEPEESLERSSKEGESDSEDTTTMLWDEWKRRLEGQTLQETTSKEESSVVFSATAAWQKLQIYGMSAIKGASWISDNREFVGGGVVASGSIFFVLFIRQKVFGLWLGKKKKKEVDLKVDRTPTRAQLSSSSRQNSGQDPWGFLQAVPKSFIVARNRFLGSEEGSAKFEKASSSKTASSSSSGESTMVGSDDVPLNAESGPATRQSEDNMLPKRQEARENSANIMQYLSSDAVRFLRPSEALPDRLVKRPNDRQGDRGSNGPEIGDAIYGSGVRDLTTLESSDLQRRKNGKGDGVVYKNSQSPPSTSYTVNDSSKSLKSPAEEENISSYIVDDSPFTGTRALPLAYNTKDERSSAARSYRGSVEDMIVGKGTGGGPREKAGLVTPERRRNVGKDNILESRTLYEDSTYQTRDSDIKGYSVPASVGQPSSWPSSRPVQLDPLVYRLKTADKERVRTEFQDGFASASSFPEEVDDAVSSSKSASTKSTSLLFGRSDLHDGEEGAPSCAQVTQGEEVISDSGVTIGSPQSRETLSPTNGGSNSKFIDNQTKGFHLGMMNGQSSGIDVPYSTTEQKLDRDIMFKSTSTGAPDPGMEILPTSTGESSEITENEVQDAKFAEIPGSGEQVASQIPQENIYDEVLISSASFKRRSWESEVQEDDSARAFMSNEDAGATGREMHKGDVWAGTATTAFEASSFKHPYKGKSGYSRASASVGREFDRDRPGQCRPELDSFIHNENFWVRDCDGVFIKHPRETQGMILQAIEGSRLQGNVRGLKDEAVNASTAPKRPFTKLHRDANPAVKEERRHKQKKSISSGFDYRQLYLKPDDDNRPPGEAPGSSKYSTSRGRSDTGKTGPVRYGVERTR